jgi:hypothetical protein
VTPEERAVIRYAVMEAAKIRGMGRDNSDREGLAWRVVAILEREGSEMCVWSGEDPVRNAGRKEDLARQASRNRMDDANDSAHPNKVTMAELQKRKR